MRETPRLPLLEAHLRGGAKGAASSLVTSLASGNRIEAGSLEHNSMPCAVNHAAAC